jgi:hypothetical protein
MRTPQIFTSGPASQVAGEADLARDWPLGSII